MAPIIEKHLVSKEPQSGLASPLSHPMAIVIGASAGGVDALVNLASDLPGTLDAAVFIVLHIGAHPSGLPDLLTAAGALSARHAQAGERVTAGQVYVAPPDHHMTIQNGYIRLSRGPRENWARPAINPLFRSAAAEYGADLIGVILTGRLNDGSTGLMEVKRRGGTTIVQSPGDAAYPAMPSSALAHVEPDHCLPLSDIGPLLVRLVTSQDTRSIPSLASEGVPAMTSSKTFDRPIALTCPDCGGALRPVPGGTLVEYRCHIQHIYTAEVLAEAHFEYMERTVRAGERIVHERSELCLQRAEHAEAMGNSEHAHLWRAAARQALNRAYELRDLIEQDWLRPETDLPVLAPAA